MRYLASVILFFFALIGSAQAKSPNRPFDGLYPNNISGFDSINIDKQQITNLTLIGQVWGFLKYHHPAVSKGAYKMDSELLSMLPTVLNSRDNSELSTSIEKWVDKFGIPNKCKRCQPEVGKDVAQQPDYGSIFNNEILNSSLIRKLKYILENRNTDDHYYVGTAEVAGNPLFRNEMAYREMKYPAVEYRLLSLYRYWNIVQYFYPYKHLTGKNWNDVLTEFLPQFIKSSNATEYVVVLTKLIANVHDGHANIGSGSVALEHYRGDFSPPFQAKFIENKLVVTGYYNDTLNIKQLVKIGDVINKINGLSIDTLVKKYLPFTGASNYVSELKRMKRHHLLRSNNKAMSLDIFRDGKEEVINVRLLEYNKLNLGLDYDPDPKQPAYKRIDGDISYLFPGRYKNKDLPAIKKTFDGTKGMIIDLRSYPGDDMAFTFAPYIKSGNAEYVMFTRISTSYPGLLKFSKPFGIRGTGKYTGKVVVIVNEDTQSKAEYTAMCFQASPNVTVIGSTTAGADGNVSEIVLPGGITTWISGVGILYPDGTETQRQGIKINIQIKPTIYGIKTGKDELLEKAKQIINDSR